MPTVVDISVQRVNISTLAARVSYVPLQYDPLVTRGRYVRSYSNKL